MNTKGNILIAGGSGFIGQKLAQSLAEAGFRISILTRIPKKEIIYKQYQWDPDNNYIQDGAFENVDFLVNLTGANISEQRWSPKQKEKLEYSRTRSTDLLFNTFKQEQTKLKAYIAASAIGFYGASTSDKIFMETDSPGYDFLAGLCKKWEISSLQFNEHNIRTVILRTGVVFDRFGGAFPKMTGSLKYGFIAGVGTGNQYIPWIHLEDLVNMYIYAINNTNMNGIYNAVAPDFITQNTFTNKVKAISGKFRFPNLPGFLLKTGFGEMSTILLNGSRVSAEKILNSGFEFKYPQIGDALSQLLKE